MMKTIVLLLGLASAVASPAAGRKDAVQVVEKWAAAFRASDVDAIVALYSAERCFWAPAAGPSCSPRRKSASISSARS